MEGSLLIGKNIEYSSKSPTAGTTGKVGTVVDKVTMLEDRKGVMHVVTGYMIRDESGKLDTIAYWRLKGEIQA